MLCSFLILIMLFYQSEARVITSRYCQRCGQVQNVYNPESARPCMECGSSQFDLHPKRHVLTKGWELTETDVVFLRCQGIRPDAGF